MSDPRIDSLVDEAMRLRLSRRSIMRRGAALGLSTAAVSGVLSTTGRASAAPRAAALIQERQLNTLQATYFVPEGQEFFTQVAQDWGSQNGVAVTTDYIAWPDLQPRIAAAVEGGSGADVIEMWDTWPYLYSENMVPVEDLARAVSEEYGGFYDWVVKTASVDGKWYSVPHGTSSIAYAYRISLFEEAGIEDPKNNFPKTYDELFAVGKTLKEMGKPLGQALGQSLGDPPALPTHLCGATARWRLKKTAPPSPSTSRSSSTHYRLSPSIGRTLTTRPGSPGTTPPTTVPSSQIKFPAPSTAAASTSPRWMPRRANRRSTTRSSSSPTISGTRLSRKDPPGVQCPR